MPDAEGRATRGAAATLARRPPGRTLAPPLIRIGRVAGDLGGKGDAVDSEGTLEAGRQLATDGKDGRLATLDLVDGALQQAAVGGDRLVGGAEVLHGPVLDAAKALHRPLVVDVDVLAHARIGLVLLLVRVEAVVVAAVLLRPVVGQLVYLEPLGAHGGPVDGCAEAGEDSVRVAALVIDGVLALRKRSLVA